MRSRHRDWPQGVGSARRSNSRGPPAALGGPGHLMAEAARVLGTLTWAPCGFPSAGQAESGRSHTLSGGGGA